MTTPLVESEILFLAILIGSFAVMAIGVWICERWIDRE